MALRSTRTIIGLTFVSALLFACSDSSEQAAKNDPKLKPERGLIVEIGPTPIPNGEAQGSNDITVSNSYFSVAFSLSSASPWGVARGGILDIGIKDDGTLGNDVVSLVDFMPNYWSAWPSTYQATKVLEVSPSKVVVRTERDWGKVQLISDFEFSADSNLIRIHTTMKNMGSETLDAIKSGYIAWPKGGHLFGMPGITEGDSRPISDAAAFAKWSASYDQDWSLGLHANFSDLVAYNGRDRYLRHNLAPHEVKNFEAWLQVEPNADLSKFVEIDAKLNKRKTGLIKASVIDSEGGLLHNAVIIVTRDEQVYTWAQATQGEHSFGLPEGEYSLYATAQSHAPGTPINVTSISSEVQEITLGGLSKPGQIEFSVLDKNSGMPLDAMISLRRGTKPLVGYFGKSRYFTELANQGQVQTGIAPGAYTFDVSAAGGFLSKVRPVVAKVVSEATTTAIVEIQRIPNPAKNNWFNADLHHHSDVLDGFTEPEYVLRSQLAAGVSVSFLSDHDSVVNNAEMRDLSRTRDTEFIPATELSASWGHFNAYPIEYGLAPNPDAILGTVQDIYAEARRLGAEVIHVNHPFGNYGYFDSLDREVNEGLTPGSLALGGYDLGFDLIEITSEHDVRTLNRAWQLWNEGKPAYFAAGSDVHDVWNTLPEHSSGAARSFVYLDQELTVDSYISALKAGHSYASQGPIIYPEHIFGETIEHLAGQPLTLSYELQSVVGLVEIQLIEKGQVIDKLDLSETTQNTVDSAELKPAIFEVKPVADTWYSVVVSGHSG